MPAWPGVLRRQEVRDLVLVALLCASLTAALFGRSLFFGFAPVDDGELVMQNLAVHGSWTQALHISFTTFDPELYIPVTLLSYRLTAAVSDTPAAFHAVNLLLHVCNATLLYLLIVSLTKKRTWAMLAAAVFTIHPVNVETVVWLSARKDLLMAFFGLLSANVLVRARTEGGKAGAAVLFLFSLLSKPSAMLAPLILVSGAKRQQWLIAVFGSISACIAIIAAVGKSHLITAFSPVSSLLIVAKGIALTIGKIFLLVPERLTYDEHAVVSLLTPSYALSVAACCAVFAGILVLRKKNRTASGGLLLFVLLLVPALANARAGSPLLAPDRYAYFPFAALLIAIVSLVPQAADRLMNTHGKIAAAVVGVFCAFAVARTIPLVSTWASPESLYGRVLRIDPASSPSRVALARLRLQNEDIEGAFELLRQGLAYGDDAFLHMGAAEVYAAAGQTEDALNQLQQAEKFDSTSADPVYTEGLILAEIGKTQEAADAFERSLQLDPSFAEAHIALARIQMDNKQWADAEVHLREAVRLRHSSYDAHVLLAELLRATGRMEEAQEHENDAKILRPQE